MTLRQDIHEALGEVTPAAPHLPHVTLARLHEQNVDKRHRPTAWTALAIAAMVVLAVGAALLIVRSLEKPAVPAIPSQGGVFRGTLDSGQSSTPAYITNDGSHRLYWRVFVNDQLTDAGFELQIFYPDGKRFMPQNRMPVPQLLEAVSPGVWKFVVHNIGTGKAAWRLEVADVPAYPTLSEGTVEGTLPTTELPVIVIGPLKTGRYSLSLSEPPPGAQILFEGISTTDGQQVVPSQLIPAGGLTVHFEVTNPSATYGMAFLTSHTEVPPPIRITLTAET